MKKLKFIIIGLILLLLVPLFLILTGKRENPSLPPPINPTIIPISTFPTTVIPDQGLPPIPGQSKEYQESIKKIETTEGPQIAKDALVGKLLNKLPFAGEGFTLYYDYTNIRFVLTLERNNLSAGNKNFIDFLKQNGIDDPSWIKDMLTQYK